MNLGENNVREFLRELEKELEVLEERMSFTGDPTWDQATETTSESIAVDLRNLLQRFNLSES